MTDIDRVPGNVKIADRRAFEVVVEHEIVLSAAAENRDAVTNVDEGVVSSRATHCLEIGRLGRRAGTNDVYGQRLRARVAGTIVDFGDIGDRKRVAVLQEIQIRVVWI